MQSQCCQTWRRERPIRGPEETSPQEHHKAKEPKSTDEQSGAPLLWAGSGRQDRAKRRKGLTGHQKCILPGSQRVKEAATGRKRGSCPLPRGHRGGDTTPRALCTREDTIIQHSRPAHASRTTTPRILCGKTLGCSLWQLSGKELGKALARDTTLGFRTYK